uniref:Uncharacterized protein n=1 Tax=Piliocolobus tephrosceles TaxID=591936 RepID=A0A8C9GZJ9_9PRIM
LRLYIFHIDLPTFVNSSVNPSSFERAPTVMVNSCFLSLLLVIVELSTDLSARLGHYLVLCVCTLQFFHSSANKC